MLTNFEQITHDLTDKELSMVEPLCVILRLIHHSKPMKSPDIVTKFNQNYDSKITDVRLRKLVHHIRANKILPVCSTSDGYFVSFDRKILESQCLSMDQRARSIKEASDGLRFFTVEKPRLF